MKNSYVLGLAAVTLSGCMSASTPRIVEYRPPTCGQPEPAALTYADRNNPVLVEVVEHQLRNVIGRHPRASRLLVREVGVGKLEATYTGALGESVTALLDYNMCNRRERHVTVTRAYQVPRGGQQADVSLNPLPRPERRRSVDELMRDEVRRAEQQMQDDFRQLERSIDEDERRLYEYPEKRTPPKADEPKAEDSKKDLSTPL